MALTGARAEFKKVDGSNGIFSSMTKGYPQDVEVPLATLRAAASGHDRTAVEAIGKLGITKRAASAAVYAAH